jgi:hypothetical protein
VLYQTSTRLVARSFTDKSNGSGVVGGETMDRKETLDEVRS